MIGETTRMKKEIFFSKKFSEEQEKTKIEMEYKLSHLDNVLLSKVQQLKELEQASKTA